MASLLRQVVAGPRAKHPEAGLDLCYVTDNIIATSGPSQTYPQRAYRNPLDRLVTFLDAKHGDQWAIWEFRAEGTGYPDSLVYGRVRHYPWPDHHPPPFGLVPLIVESMREWKNGQELFEDQAKSSEEAQKNKGEKNERVVVVHCKAGKGRSGTMACSYLIAECGWTAAEALARFTERRMRPNFGPGVSIPSQLRWVGYVERWANAAKVAASATGSVDKSDEERKTRSKRRSIYKDRPVEVLEVKVWGLRNGVKVAVEGFVENGKVIRALHTFNRRERNVLEAGAPGGDGLMDMFYDMAGYGTEQQQEDAGTPEEGAGNSQRISRTSSLLSKVSRSASKRRSRIGGKKMAGGSNDGNNGGVESDSTPNTTSEASSSAPTTTTTPTTATATTAGGDETEDPGGRVVIFRPEEKTGPIRIPTSDINITLERRHRAPSALGLTMVTAVAHVWFNVWFEGGGPEAVAAASSSTAGVNGEPAKEGVFGIDWDQMDGIKGSGQKGTRAAERVEVVWRLASDNDDNDTKEGEKKTSTTGVPQMPAADWTRHGGDEQAAETAADPDAKKHLGLRAKSPDVSGDASLASSLKGEGCRDSVGANSSNNNNPAADAVAAAAAAMGSSATAPGSGPVYASGGGEDPMKGVKSDVTGTTS